MGIVFITISNIFGLYPAQVIRETFKVLENKYLNKSFDTSEFLFAQHIADLDLSHLLMAFGLIVLGLAIAKGIFTFLMRQTIIVMSRLIEFDLKNEIFSHYQDLDATFYKLNNTGDIMNRISEDVTRVRMYLGPGIMYTINLAVLFVLVIGKMISINPKLTFYSLAPLPILSLLIYIVSNKINKQSEVVQSELSNLSTVSQETFSGIRVIKSFVKETFISKKYGEASEAYMNQSLKLVKINALFHPIMMLLIGLSTIFTIYVGANEYLKGNIDSPGYIAEFIIYVNMLTWPVTALGWVTSLVQRAAASQKRINEFLQTKPVITYPKTEDIAIKGKIEFRNVSFTYPESGIVALKNINFKIEPGETLAIIGKTGSGKSSIAQLILRIYDATEGEILIDDKPIKSYDLQKLRKHIGYVPQEVFLFSDSIKNNIAFGFNNGELPSSNVIEQATKDAVVYHNIIDFPNQFETKLGERGVTLSGGQKQRISIARAIIKSPEILIFDDCLSAVDTETESEILNNLTPIMKNKTSIIISHRISSIKHANEILVLENGEIVEKGTHEELLKNKNIYYETYQKQLLESENRR
ncbi:MAG: ABC transporter ATP-binding protein [Vicingaceae bacterium]